MRSICDRVRSDMCLSPTYTDRSVTLDWYWPRTPMVVNSVTTSGTFRISASRARLISVLRSMDEPGGASATTSNSLMSSSTTNSSLAVVRRTYPPTRIAPPASRQMARWPRHQPSAAS